jgi:hypothetical protein
MMTPIVVFWIVKPSALVSGYKRFGGRYRLHIQVLRRGLVGNYQNVGNTTQKHLHRHENLESHSR